MSAQSRRAELEAKKRRLEELRNRRLIRQQAASAKAAGGAGAPATRKRERGDDILNKTNLLMTKYKTNRSQEQAEAKSAAPAIPTGAPRKVKLEVQERVEPYDIFPQPTECYDKGVGADPLDIAQAADLVSSDSTPQKVAQVMAAFASTRADAWPPRDGAPPVERQSTSTPAETKDAGTSPPAPIQYESEKEEEEDDGPMIMDTQEALQMIRTNEFRAFFEKASLIMERVVASNQTVNLFVDYTKDDRGEDTVDTTQVARVALKNKFTVDVTRDRPITSIQFSHLNPELFLASYAQPQQSITDLADGSVFLWSQMLPHRPEFRFQCQSMVTAARFHPSNPKLVIGATISGQIVVWDMRARKTPVTRSPFGAGHTNPVFAMSFLPSSRKVQHVLTVSNNANLCVWRDDILEEPSHSAKLKLRDDLDGTRDELATTCFSYSPRDTNTVVLGSDEGWLYKGEIYSDATKEGMLVSPIRAHSGPITNVHYHPVPSNAKFNLANDVVNLYLTSSFDWSVRLWDNKSNKCLYTFELSDYVYDVKWSPVHPSVFACGDGRGNLTIYNLDRDFEGPAIDQHASDNAINRIEWSLDGKHVLVGDAMGDLLMYEVSQELWDANEEHATKFHHEVTKLLKAKR